MPNKIAKPKLSWKDVFNGSKKHWRHIGAAEKTAFDAGYEYFAWNERIYTVYESAKHDGTYRERDTGLTPKDLA